MYGAINIYIYIYIYIARCGGPATREVGAGGASGRTARDERAIR